ncbi:hypothetical protein JZ751_024299 [Albula glossodonta]|uniref:Uncharacterized protein n=1 Tax=Albula glossodonta TaxID=121402 RepID=A0A8T2NF62_9TELE|nr:hypothetical protein JZ751_024299 [Albula glossodonta]
MSQRLDQGETSFFNAPPVTSKESVQVQILNVTLNDGLPLSVFDKLSWTLGMAECQFVKYPK